LFRSLLILCLSIGNLLLVFLSIGSLLFLCLSICNQILILVSSPWKCKGGLDYFWIVEGTCILLCVFLFSLSLFTLSAALNSEHCSRLVNMDKTIRLMNAWTYDSINAYAQQQIINNQRQHYSIHAYTIKVVANRSYEYTTKNIHKHGNRHYKIINNI